MDKWEVRFLDNELGGDEVSYFFTDINRVCVFEAKLRAKGIEYRTIYFEGDKNGKKAYEVKY